MKRADDGFTLVELLLSIAILMIILGSITTALIVFLNNGREALERDDHSGGSAVAASYFDRDVASADTITTGGTTCSGSTNIVLLSWFEYSATTAAPSPAPSGQPYRSAYTVVADPESVPVGGGARYQLQRVNCLGGTVLSRSTLVQNLASSTSKATATLTSDSSCTSGQALTLVLAPYSADTSAPYTFRACTKTRLST
jgi:type II secretory pathway component PulJ